ncbi:GNAT family N-acetyltransferase [Thalassococcus sp. CAU 1522]|uniref:GNAT family N-acetyltransferase n=1 Tax=Thalassococcus arenae TaxID=2851652 RepID=A0ABS6N7F4_9RHOB|nr:GNAT family N-acetyltransferase [Thalassococcus arenae]MBV2359514.1 GNAT family N-acetyltransferase [Thalassococcus arenae]
MTLTVRDMQRSDVPACVDIINHIIALGGSTAHEEPFDKDSFATEYFRDPAVANVVLSGDRIVGFQAAFDVGDGLYSIGSFTDRKHPVRGAGRALFDKTLADCRARGGVAILAKITADNALGLTFYSRMGFRDFEVWSDDHVRPDGTSVDRIVKRFPL